MLQPPILIIDTATARAMVGIISDQVLGLKLGSERIRADDLLVLVDQALTEANLTLFDLTGICVRQGLGSYTGLRVGVTVANTLAWMLAQPLLGLTSRPIRPLNLDRLARDHQKIRQRLAKTSPPSKTTWLVPKYGRWQPLATSATIVSAS